jgi:hypothetical protein
MFFHQAVLQTIAVSAILNMNMFSRKTVVAAGQIDKDYMMRNASGRFSLSKVPY